MPANEYQKLHASWAPRKGKVTLKMNQLQKAIDAVDARDTWSEWSEIQVKAKMRSLEEQLLELEKLGEEIESVINSSVDGELVPDNAKTVTKMWKEYEAMAADSDELSRNAAEVMAALFNARPAGAAAAATGPAASKFKDNASLKPEQLTTKHSPKQYADWKKQLNAYIRSSEMTKYPEMSVAHEYILTCLGDELTSRVRNRCNPDHNGIWEVDGTQGIVELIEEEFFRAYPLITRRLAFFQLKQLTGESLNEYIVRTCALRDDADCRRLTEDQLTALFFMIGLQDKKLREHLLLTDATGDWERLKAATLSFAAVTTSNEMMSNPARSNFAGGGSCGGGRGGRGGRGGGRGGYRGAGGQRGGGEAGAWDRRAPRLDRNGKCRGCGRNGGCHDKEKGNVCVAKGPRAKCTCGVPGHLRQYCYTEGIPRTKANNITAEDWEAAARGESVQDADADQSAHGSDQSGSQNGDRAGATP